MFFVCVYFNQEVAKMRFLTVKVKKEATKMSATKENMKTIVDVPKLKGKIVEQELDMRTLAEKIGMDKSTFYRKINNGGSFSIEEAQAIAIELELTDSEAISIFFKRIVA
jgi:hypothetical protein